MRDTSNKNGKELMKEQEDGRTNIQINDWMNSE